MESEDARDKAVEAFIEWLYDECPVSTDEVTRHTLLVTWMKFAYTGKTPAREEILPHTRIMTPQERKDTLLKILK